MLFDGLASIFFDSKMKFLKCFVYFLTLIILGNFVLTGKEKVLPKAPTPKWSDFKYNSEEEKEFWDQISDFKILDHYGWQRINSKGNKIDHDPFYKGYTGYQKKIERYTSRILLKYQDGFLIKRASWYKSGKKKSEETYKDGKRVGVWNEWYENGQKKSEINYKDGNREGFSTKWHSNGQKETEGNYKEGKQEGLWVRWHLPDALKIEGNFKEGKREGLFVVWHEDGQKIEGSYEEVKRLLETYVRPAFSPIFARFREAKIDSTYALSPWSKFNYNSEEEKEFWDKLPDWTTNRAFNTPRTRKNGGGETIDKNSSEGFDGYVKYNSESYRTIYQFVDGYTSRWKSWFKSGKQMGEGKFLKENRDGTWNECYENGQKKSERNYKDGKVSGNAQFWTEDGKPSRFILSLPSLPSRWISTSKKQQE